jgi:hypothetical protein
MMRDYEMVLSTNTLTPPRPDRLIQGGDLSPGSRILVIIGVEKQRAVIEGKKLYLMGREQNQEDSADWRCV